MLIAISHGLILHGAEKTGPDGGNTLAKVRL